MSLFDKKICFVIPSFSFGGAERVVTVLSSQLAREGYDVSVIKYFEVSDEYPVDDRVKVFNVSRGTESMYHALSFAEKIRRIRKILKEIRPDYVVPFLSHVATRTFFAGLGMPIKMIQTIRIAPNIAPASRLLRAFRNFLIAVSYVTFVQTETQKEYFPRWMHKKIVILPNPVSQSMLESSPVYQGQTTKIVSMGRLTLQKNFEMLIRSVVELKNTGYPVTLDIYGEGELHQSLQQQIDELSCQDICRLQGRTSDVPNVLKNASLFVLPSNFEGMPNALMEAMAVGLPCISTDCETGPGELLADGKGLLVPVNDQSAMTEAIKALVETPQAATEMGRRAKEYMSEVYSPAAISNRFVRDVILRGKA